MSNEELVCAYQRILSEKSRRADHSGDPRLERNKRLAARMFIDIVSDKNYAAADEIFAPDFYWPQFGLHGPEGVRTWAREFHAGWPDVRDIIEMQVAEGDMVVTLVTVYGTQTGPWLGLPATGRFVAFPAVGIDRIVNGRIVERSSTYNFAEVMRGLGLNQLPGVPAGSARTYSSAKAR